MMKENASFKRFALAALIGLAGAAAGLLTPMLIPAVALIAFIGVCWGPSYFAIAIAFTLCGVACGNSSGPIPLISMTASVAAAASLLTFGLRKKLPYRYITLGLAALCFAGLYCSIGLGNVLAGKAPYKTLVDNLAAYADTYRKAGTSGAAELIETIGMLSDTIPVVFYGMLIMISEGATLATVLLARQFCKLGGDLRPMARFREWQLPQSLKIGLPVLAGGVIVLLIAKVDFAQPVLYTVLYMLLPIFAAAGLGCLLFVGERRNNGFMKVIAFLMLFIAPFFTSIIGVFDLYSGLRRRMLKIDRLVKEAFERAEKEQRNTVTVDFGDGRGPQIIAVRRKRIEEAFFDSASDPKQFGEYGAKREDRTENDEDTDKYGNAVTGGAGEKPEDDAPTNENDDHENGGGEE
jgi:hypothetical protein